VGIKRLTWEVKDGNIKQGKGRVSRISSWGNEWYLRGTSFYNGEPAKIRPRKDAEKEAVREKNLGQTTSPPVPQNALSVALV